MKAIWFNEFGAAKDVLVFGEKNIGDPGKGEVLVKMHTSGVNPSDVKKRAGASPTLLNNGYVIPNSDGAGIIVRTGAEVSENRIGERVWLFNGQYGRRFGTSAEYITINGAHAVKLPDNASYEIGACIGIPMMTAHRCITIAGNIKDQYVLVTGGAGRVGYYAIQWAKYFGAKVIATAGSETSVQSCIEAGADLVIPHPSEDANKKILEFTNGNKIDLVVEGDFGINLPFVLNVLKTSGSIATYSSMTIPEPSLPFRKMLFMDVNVRIVLVYAMPIEAKLAAIKDITKILENNVFKHRVSKVLPLKDAAVAHEEIEKGNNYGCIILKIN